MPSSLPQDILVLEQLGSVFQGYETQVKPLGGAEVKADT